MPALFALAQQQSLVQAFSRLDSNDHIFAFLDDIYIYSSRLRAHTAFHIVSQEIQTGAGVRTHLGKLKGWSRETYSVPPGFENMDDTF